jgi:HPt (histidine-containing phosphotransfer) domain-containing protein
MATMQSQRATATQALASGEPPIDWAHLDWMALGDHALAREVLALFCRQIDVLVGRMDAADPSDTMKLAHTLKGSARGVGAWPLARAAEAVEAAPPAERARAIAALATVAAEARAAIAEILAAA